MATQPEPGPDRIDPQSPPETPGIPDDPAPPASPPETPGIPPDFDQPGTSPDEIP
ncbi:MAG: hypothetical protein R3D89_06450 [Sphingomonadaceae bacterium]